MAILLDEYGGVAGLVTFLEDLLEEIVGEIDVTKQIKPVEVLCEIGENTYIVEGAAMTLNDFTNILIQNLRVDDVGYYRRLVI